MAQSSSGNDDQITGINVTPLVDVMLVLLIIFMVTANLVNARSIAVELPKAATGEENVPAKNLAFVIDRSGTLFLDGKHIEIAEMSGLIARARASSQKVQALIGADQAGTYGPVVKVIDELRKNGITDFALNVQSE